MSLRFQRLIIILVSLILTTCALILILTNFKKNIVFFYTPSELITANIEINQNIRIGGLVKHNSLKKISNSKNNLIFVVTDNINDILVEYSGSLPDLFREKQGTVVEGILVEKNKIKATRIFAKHDENYIPASIKKQLKANDYWQNDYASISYFNEKLPEFTAESLTDNNLKLTNYDINNNITLINFFASWCLPCKEEHHLLINLKKNFPKLSIIGFNYKDNEIDAVKYLSANGNPYDFVGVDYDGKIGIEFGVFGLPETFLTNNKGSIIYKITGPMSYKVIQKEIVPNL